MYVMIVEGAAGVGVCDTLPRWAGWTTSVSEHREAGRMLPLLSIADAALPICASCGALGWATCLRGYGHHDWRWFPVWARRGHGGVFQAGRWFVVAAAS